MPNLTPRLGRPRRTSGGSRFICDNGATGQKEEASLVTKSQRFAIGRAAGPIWLPCMPRQRQRPKRKGGSLSLSPATREAGTERADQLGFRSFSAYVSALIHKDLNTPDGCLVLPPKKGSAKIKAPDDE